MPDHTCVFEKVFECSLDGVLLTRSDGVVLRANRSACEALRRTEKELCLLERGELVVEDEPLRELRARRATLGAVAGEVDFRRPDGSTFPAEFTSGLIPTSGEPLFYVIFRDATERRRLEQRLRRSNRVHGLLTACNEALVRATTEAGLFADLCRVMVEVGGYRMCWVGLADPNAGGPVRPVAQAGDEGYLTAAGSSWLGTLGSAGPTAEALRTGEPVVGRDLAAGATPESWREEALRRGYRSCTALPLTHAGRPIGAITAYSTEVGAVDESELRTLVQLSSDLAYGIQSIREREARERAERALRRSEELLRLFVEHAPAAVAMFDLDMRYLAVSRRFASDYRLKRQDLLGRSHYEIFPEIPERWREIHRRTLAGAVEKCDEDPFPRPDGTLDWVRWEIRPWRDTGGEIGGIVLFSEIVTERKRAEERLAAERDRLSVTLQSIGDAVIATDGAARITVFNGVAEALTGWKAAEALGEPLQRVLQLVREDARGEEPNPVDRVLREGLPVAMANHAALVARDGSARSIANSGAPIRDASGRVAGAVLVIRDQTDERRAQRELLESTEQARARAAELQAVLDAVPAAVFITRDREARHMSPNRYCAELLRVPAGSNVSKSAPPGERVQTYRAMRNGAEVPPEELPVQVAARRGVYLRDCELDLAFDDGTVRHLMGNTAPLRDLAGRTTGAVGAFVDITERKRNEERFRALIEKSSDMIVVLDAELRVAFWSPSAIEQLGWAAHEALGRTAVDLVHADDRAGVAATLDGLVRRPGATERFDGRALRKDGSICLVGAVARNLLQEPAVQGVVLNLRDVTSQRQLEEQLRQSQKMEGIGHLAGGVAHDFNNLLSVILSCATFALEGLRDGDPLRDDLLQIESAGKRAASLTRHLLAFSRKQVLQPELLDLNRVIAETEKMLHRILGEDVELVQLLAPDLGIVKADPGQISQVILNLAVNARDAMPCGGRLILETANVELDPALAALPLGPVPGPCVMVAVRDNGSGMDTRTKARIFEPFFTTKGPGKGSGLGLSTVYGIVRQSGGAIAVESEPGRGATFRIYLPRAPAPVPGAAPRRSAAARSSGGVETVLVVEDDEAVRGIACRILANAGYDVLTAAGGSDGLELCQRHPGEIHLLLTDVVMPLMSGRVFVEHLGKMRPRTKILYMSGYTDDAIVHHGVLNEGTRFIGKPLTQSELLRKVREALDE